jgi:hypothetical protein
VEPMKAPLPHFVAGEGGTHCEAIGGGGNPAAVPASPHRRPPLTLRSPPSPAPKRGRGIRWHASAASPHRHIRAMVAPW